MNYIFIIIKIVLIESIFDKNLLLIDLFNWSFF